MIPVQVTLTFTDDEYEVLKYPLPFQKKTLGEYAVGAIISFLQADIDAVLSWTTNS